jgi:MinD-like ATPase involved in chromosome partitioning or flagellar assembly
MNQSEGQDPAWSRQLDALDESIALRQQALSHMLPVDVQQESALNEPDHADRVALPNLRHKAPTPVIPWPLRVQAWLRQRTHSGRTEAAHDAALTGLLARLATGTHTLAVIGPKGGAGKSTTALATGLVLAQVPLARPILVEVNPDWGTLDELLGTANPRTIADLLRDYTAIDRAGVGLLQGYVTMFGRLPVLTAPSDPDAMARLTPRDYDRVLRLLALHYNVIILDCGTAFTQRLNQFAIQRAAHLVVVGWPEQATMRKTLAAIDYLASARYERDYRGTLAEVAGAGDDGRGDIRARALVDVTLALNGVGHTGGQDPVDPRKVREAAAGLHAVIDLPYVPALRALLEDGTLTIEALPAAYRRAAKALLVVALGGLAERNASPM